MTMLEIGPDEFVLPGQEYRRLLAAELQQAKDAERIAFLEKWSKQSRTGVSLEWSPEDGYRVMTFHKVDRGQDTARAAIDAAISLRPA